MKKKAVVFPMPAGYGDNRVVLMARDPWWIYAYWEIGTPGQVMRVHQASKNFFDIHLPPATDHWYIDAGIPDQEWFVEIGAVAGTGQFIPWVKSNSVRTPPYGFSDAIDKKWVPAEGLYGEPASLPSFNSESLSLAGR